MKVLGIKIDEELLEALDNCIKKKGLNRSKVIRDAIRELLNDENNIDKD